MFLGIRAKLIPKALNNVRVTESSEGFSYKIPRSNRMLKLISKIKNN